MDRKKKLYTDIINAIDLITAFTVDIQSFDKYSSDSKTKSAVERQLAIIGEAITKLKKEDAEELTNARKIITLRNILVHAYDSIDDTIIWAVLQRHLAPLKQEVDDKLIGNK